MQKLHGGFITKIDFTNWDDGQHFITVSQDKAIKVHNFESRELIVEKAGIHSMGINDFCQTQNEGEIATCSSDRTIKVWKLNIAEKSLDEVRTL